MKARKKVVKFRGKGVKPSRILVPMRLSRQVVAYFKKYPNFSAEVRRVLEEHVEKVSHAEQTANNQQRWQDIPADTYNQEEDD